MSAEGQLEQWVPRCSAKNWSLVTRLFDLHLRFQCVDLISTKRSRIPKVQNTKGVKYQRCKAPRVHRCNIQNIKGANYYYNKENWSLDMLSWKFILLESSSKDKMLSPLNLCSQFSLVKVKRELFEELEKKHQYNAKRQVVLSKQELFRKLVPSCGDNLSFYQLQRYKLQCNWQTAVNKRENGNVSNRVSCFVFQLGRGRHHIYFQDMK